MVPTRHRDLAPVAPVNPLVSRGIADLVESQEVRDEVSLSSRHPFDPQQQPKYRGAQRLLKLLMRARAIKGLAPHVPHLRLPQAGAVKPPLPNADNDEAAASGPAGEQLTDDPTDKAGTDSGDE